MATSKKKVGYGFYNLLRDGEIVATVQKVVDTGEPIWELTIRDGTPYRSTRSGRTIREFVSLGDAQKSYDWQRQKAGA